MEFKKECERKAYEKAKAAYDALMKYYPFTTDDLPGEEWKIIDEHYQGSTFGRIKSFWHGKEKIFFRSSNYRDSFHCESRRKTRSQPSRRTLAQ